MILYRLVINSVTPLFCNSAILVIVSLNSRDTRVCKHPCSVHIVFDPENLLLFVHNLVQLIISLLFTPSVCFLAIARFMAGTSVNEV